MIYEWGKMFRFIKKVFIAAVNIILSTFLGCSGLNAIPLKCVSMSNHECKLRQAIVNINSNESLFYPCNFLVNKCNGSCNDPDNSYANLGVPDVVKSMNIKVFNLISRTNETSYLS